MIKCENEISDLLNFVTPIFTVIGLFFTFYQIKEYNKQKRAEYIIDLYNKYTSDQNVMNIYYEIVSGKFKCDRAFHPTPDEQNLEKLLGFFENIAMLYVMKNITIDDLKYVACEFIVIYQNSSVKEYLTNLDKRNNNLYDIEIKKYEAFRKVGKLLEEKYVKKNL